MRRRNLLIALVLVVGAATLPASPIGAPASASRGIEISTRRLGPGVTYKRIVDRRTPRRILVIEVDPSKGARIDLTQAYGISDRARTSTMARRSGALAAINGSFFFPYGRPVGMFAQDGLLKTSAMQGQPVFAPAADGKRFFINYPSMTIKLLPPSGGLALGIDAWNEPHPRRGSLAAFTQAGGAPIAPPEDACAARVFSAGGVSWGPGGYGVTKRYKIDRVRCGWKAMARRGGVVFAGARGTSAADAVRKLTPGKTMDLVWSTGLAGVLDVVSGYPILVQGGRVALEPGCVATGGCSHSPRTGIGITADNRVLLVTVDGRRPRYSRGMTHHQLARQFVRLGATSAINLDGGGSTTMVVNDRVVNRPSDGPERYVNNAVLVLPGRDGGEPFPLSAGI